MLDISFTPEDVRELRDHEVRAVCCGEQNLASDIIEFGGIGGAIGGFGGPTSAAVGILAGGAVGVLYYYLG